MKLYMQDLPNIIIENITFTLAGYSTLKDKTEKESLKIISRDQSGLERYIYLYRSNSEMGLWRLGCFTRLQFYKGKEDYVQQTLIHFKLQMFIEQNLHRIIDIPFTIEHIEIDIEKRSEYAPIYFPYCFGNLMKTHYIPLHIDDATRMIHIEPFATFHKNPIYRCGSWREEPLFLLDLSKQFEQSYNLIEDSIEMLYTTNFEYTENSSIIQIISNYFVCYLKSKTDDTQIILYYMIYTIHDNYKTLDDLLKDSYYFPLYITTSTEISSLGTFKYYIPSGGYICKILEHVSQCRNVKTNTFFGKCLTKSYFFIGTYYNNIFPFYQIKSL
jgi:hypothetical protein